MSFSISNKSTELSGDIFNKAVSYVKANNGGVLTENQINTLETEAKKDGKFTAEEQMFISELRTNSTVFSTQAKQANYDPNSVTFATSGVKSVQINDKIVTLEFANSKPEETGIRAGKQGGMLSSPALAKDNLLRLIPVDKMEEWNKIDKTDIKAVSTFMDKLKLPQDQKLEFVKNFMTAHFAHTGFDIDWQGVKLEDALKSPNLPSDSHNRKYVDCEAFSVIAQTLMTSSGDKEKFKPYVVHVDFPGHRPDQLNHQVSVFRDKDNNAYVFSNNEYKKIDNSAGMTDEAALSTQGYTQAKFDTSGAMAKGTETMKVGDEIPSTALRPGSTGKIISIDDGNSFTAEIKDPKKPDFTYLSKVNVDPGSGDLKISPDRIATNKNGSKFHVHEEDGQINVTPKKGDKFVYPGQGTVVVGDNPPKGIFTIEKGTNAGKTLQAIISPDGGFSIDRS